MFDDSPYKPPPDIEMGEINDSNIQLLINSDVRSGATLQRATSTNSKNISMNFANAEDYMREVFGSDAHYGEICFKNSPAKHSSLPYYITVTVPREHLNEALLDLLMNRWCLMTPCMVLLPVTGTPNADTPNADTSKLYDDIVKAAIETQAWFIADSAQPDQLRKQISAQRTFKDPIPSVAVLSLDMVDNKESLAPSSGPAKRDHFPAAYTPQSGREGTKELESHHSHYILLQGRHDEIQEPTQQFLQFCGNNEKAGNLVVLLLVGGGDQELGKVRRLMQGAQSDMHLVVFEGTGGKADEIAKSLKSDAFEDLLPGINNKETRITSLCIASSGELPTKLLNIKESKRKKENHDQDWYFKMKGKLSFGDADKSCYEDMKKMYEKYYERAEDALGAMLECAIRENEVETARIILEKEGEELLAGFLTIERLEKLLRTAIDVSVGDDDLQRHDDTASNSDRRNKLPKLRKGCRGDLARLLYDEINIANTDLHDKRETERVVHQNAVKEAAEVNATLDRKDATRGNGTPLDQVEVKVPITIKERKRTLEKVPNKIKSKEPSWKTNMKKYHMSRVLFSVVAHISKGLYGCPMTTKCCDDKKEREDKIKFNYYCAMEEDRFHTHVGLDDTLRSTKCTFEHPADILALYCTLMRRNGMAMVFVERSSSPMFLALVMAQINRWIADHAPFDHSWLRKMYKLMNRKRKFVTDKRNVQEYEDIANGYEDIAVGMLDEMEGPDSPEGAESWAPAMLEHKPHKWSHVIREGSSKEVVVHRPANVIDFAAHTNCARFVEHPIVVAYIDRAWYGKLSPNQNNILLWVNLFLFWTVLPITYLAQHSSGGVEYTNDAKDRVRHFIGKSIVTRDSYKTGRDRGRLCTKVCDEMKHVYRQYRDFFTAPLIKLRYHVLSQLLFMLLFMNVLAFKFSAFDQRTVFGGTLTICELILMIWVLFGIPREIVEIKKALPHSWTSKISSHFSSCWNVNDFLCIVVLMLAYVMRFAAKWDTLEGEYPLKGENSISRACFAIGFILYSARMTQFLRLQQRLGPIIFMIQKMLKELYFFMGLLFILIIMYSVSSESLVHPDKMKFKGATVFALFERSYQNMFGNFEFADMQSDIQDGYCLLEQEANRTAKNSTDPTVCVNDLVNNLTVNYVCEDHMTCKWNGRIVFFLLCAFVMFSNVLIINLLVAVFASVYDETHSRARTIYNTQRLDTLREVTRYAAGPPIIGQLHNVWRLMKMLTSRTKKEHKGVSILVVKLRQLEAAFLKGYLKKVEEGKQTVKIMLQKVLDQKDTVNEGTVSVSYNKGYIPLEYTNPLLSQESTEGVKWNEGDRASYAGPYHVLYGRPINPWGNTGVCGRGELKRWGPNFYTLPIITRDGAGDQLQVLLTKGGQSLPKFESGNRDGHTDIERMLQEGTLTEGTLTEGTLWECALPEGTLPEGTLTEVLARGEEQYRGYYPCNENTDNAWMEVVCSLYRSKCFTLQESARAKYEWMEVTKDTDLKKLDAVFRFNDISLHSNDKALN